MGVEKRVCPVCGAGGGEPVEAGKGVDGSVMLSINSLPVCFSRVSCRCRPLTGVAGGAVSIVGVLFERVFA